MKQFLFLFVFIPFTSVCAMSPDETAWLIVNQAYKQLEKVANSNDIDAYGNSKRIFCNLFPTDDMFLPDEFSFMENGENDKIGLRCPNYFKNFRDFASSSHFTYERVKNIGNSQSLREVSAPVHAKKYAQTDFVTIFVKKSYGYGARTVTLIDTISVNIAKGQIVKFENIARKKEGIQNGNTFNMSIETMRAEAALLYQQGRIKESYEMYKKITNKATDADSYYRMAVLIYDKDTRAKIGMDKKVAMRLTMEYLNKAIEYYNGDYKLREQVKNMQYWVS